MKNSRKLKRLRPYLSQFIIKASVDEDFILDDTPVEDGFSVKEQFDAIRFTMIGQVAATTENAGKNIYHGMANCNRGDLQSLIATNGLDWTVSAFEGNAVIQNRVLSHLLPDIEYDEDENPVEVPITDCTGRLSSIAGKQWQW